MTMRTSFHRWFQIGCACAIALVIALVMGSAASDAQQTPANQTPATTQPPRGRGPAVPTDPKVPTTVSTNLPGHPSPPQPEQKQGLEYFEGSWRFSWVGRESPITIGTRSGTATFTRIEPSLGRGNFLNLQVEGTLEGEGTFKESGVLGWSPERKILVVQEKTATNVEMLSVGDWASPLSIRFDTQPLRVAGKLLKLRRSWNIISATSFSVSEDFSTDGGPFVKLGAGSFTRK